MSVGSRLLALALFCSLAVLQPCAGAGWTIKNAYHDPPMTDHEHSTTFHASVSFVNDTPEVNGSSANGTGINGTGTNGTGTNGTGTNGTGTNGTGTNGTGTNGTGTNGTGTNGTGTNGTGTNGTGTNGTGTNGTGTNGTGANGTGNNQTVNVTSCLLVFESPDNRSAGAVLRQEMNRDAGTNDFWLTLGPWPPGGEILYHYEANLSNGSVIRSNSTWLLTPGLLAVKWHPSLDEAMELARELDRPLMVLVHSGFARTNKYLDENLSRPAIIALSAGFVCCRLDNETSPGFGLGHNLGRLPALVFVDPRTGNETSRLENPFNGPLVEKHMRYVLGKGPKPSAGTEAGPQYRVEAFALGAALAAGPVALFVALRLRRRKRI